MLAQAILVLAVGTSSVVPHLKNLNTKRILGNGFAVEESEEAGSESFHESIRTLSTFRRSILRSNGKITLTGSSTHQPDSNDLMASFCTLPVNHIDQPRFIPARAPKVKRPALTRPYHEAVYERLLELLDIYRRSRLLRYNMEHSQQGRAAPERTDDIYHSESLSLWKPQRQGTM